MSFKNILRTFEEFNFFLVHLDHADYENAKASIFKVILLKHAMSFTFAWDWNKVLWMQTLSHLILYTSFLFFLNNVTNKLIPNRLIYVKVLKSNSWIYRLHTTKIKALFKDCLKKTLLVKKNIWKSKYMQNLLFFWNPCQWN